MTTTPRRRFPPWEQTAGGTPPLRTGIPSLRELAPQVVFSGMAHVAAADPRADDLAVPVIVADASGQDLLLAAVHGAQEES
eukprot:13310592-Alexandrium_andersonii.AAC.1